MKLNEYQELSTRTMPTKADKPALANYAMGLMGEAGEVGDHIKKYVFHGHELDREKVLEELGDDFHYLAGLAKLVGFTLQEVAEYNIEKLKKRYPEGFSYEASKNRAK